MLSETDFKMSRLRKSLAIVGTVGLPANYGGWETLIENIIDPLTENYDVTVFCSAKRYDVHPAMYHNAKLEFLSLDANGAQSIPYDILSLWRSRRYDRVLILGISGSIALPFFRVLFRPKYFLNIDGLEWKRQKWSMPIQIFLRFSEYLGCRAAHELVADNAVIQDHIKTAYGRASTLIAYGGDNIDGGTPIPKPNVFDGAPYSFSVCRIEPENNTHVILEAFFRMPEKNLVFIGNWNSNSYGQDLKARYASTPNIHILDPIYDRQVLDSYRANCDVYLHGHSAGGTNPSLVEAMSLGLPIAAFDVNFNRETTEHKALYFDQADALIDILRNTPEAQFGTLRDDMKSIADRRYTWRIVSDQYCDLLV